MAIVISSERIHWQINPENPQLDFSHRLADGLINCTLFDELGARNLVDGARQRIYASPTEIMTPYGAGVHFNNETGLRTPAVGALTEGSVFVKLKKTAHGTLRNIFCHLDFGGGKRIYLIDDNGTMVVRMGSAAQANRGTLPGLGEWFTLCMVWKAGSASFYVNGKPHSTSYSYTGTPGSTVDVSSWGMRYYTAGTKDSLIGDFSIGLVYNRALHESEIISLDDNPPQMIIAENDAFFMPDGVAVTFEPVWAKNINTLIGGGLNV